jgi:hypothetical protein
MECSMPSVSVNETRQERTLATRRRKREYILDRYPFNRPQVVRVFRDYLTPLGFLAAS